MNLTFCRPSDAKTGSAFESPVFLHVLVAIRDPAHWGRLFETPFFQYVSVRYGRLKDMGRCNLGYWGWIGHRRWGVHCIMHRGLNVHYD